MEIVVFVHEQRDRSMKQNWEPIDFLYTNIQWTTKEHLNQWKKIQLINNQYCDNCTVI